jgi:hypothetical protein
VRFRRYLVRYAASLQNQINRVCVASLIDVVSASLKSTDAMRYEVNVSLEAEEATQKEAK